MDNYKEIYVIKRDGRKEAFNPNKINSSIMRAAESCNKDWYEYDRSSFINVLDGDSTDEIRRRVENWLMSTDHDVAREFMLYPYKNNK